jgi:hypothetical protein
MMVRRAFREEVTESDVKTSTPTGLDYVSRTGLGCRETEPQRRWFGTDILTGTSTSSESSGLMKKNDRRACPKIMILVRLFAVPDIIASGRDRYLSPERFLGRRKLQEALALHLVDAFSRIHNLVISSSDRPLVSGISQPTRKSVSKAPEPKTQKVPSDPKCFCIIGNNWLPR